MRLLVGLLALAIIGCHSSEVFIDHGPPDAALVGSWTLVTVNGEDLPFSFVTSTNIWNVESGRLELLADVTGSLYFSDVRDSTSGQEFVENGDLSYSRDGTRVSLAFVTGHQVLTELGTVSNDTITMSYRGLPNVPDGEYAYRRP